METRILWFVIFVAANVIVNTALLGLAYKAFAGATAKVTDAMREIETSTAGREWIQSLLSASDQAVSATDSTKQRMAEFGPQLENLQARHEILLAQIDVRMERLTRGISENATRVRDAVAEPAEKFGATAAGIYNVLSFVAPRSDDDTEP